MIVACGIAELHGRSLERTALDLFDEHEQHWFRLPSQENEEIMRDEEWPRELATEWPRRETAYPWDVKRFNMNQQRGAGAAMFTSSAHVAISERHMPDMVTLPAAECTSR